MDHTVVQTRGSIVDRNLAIIFGVTLFAVMGVASITPAIPRVMDAFGLREGQAGLLITAFTLPGAFLTPLVGILADRVGRRRVLVPALCVFAVAGGLGGMVRDFEVFLALRAVQGLGAAGLGSLNSTIIGDLYQGPRRARAMGLNASVLSIGTAVYPLLGGALAVAGWNYPFLLPWLALPLGLVVHRWLDNPEPVGRASLRDYLGGAWRGLRDRRILGVFASGILIFVILYGSYLTYFSLLLGRVFQASSLVIGLVMFSMSLTTAVASSQLGGLAHRYSKRGLLMTAFTAYAVALALVPVAAAAVAPEAIGLGGNGPVTGGVALWPFLVPTLLFGVAHGINLPTLQTQLAELAPLEHRAIFMSLNGTMLRVGQTLGPVVMGLVFGLAGYSGVFWAGSLLALAGVGVVGFTLGRTKPGEAGQSPGKGS